MSAPEIRTYKSPAELSLDPQVLYLCFGYGTGDTFNAMVHLAKATPLRDYELIIKAPQLNLVLFLLGHFGQKPSVIHSVKYWKHDFAPQFMPVNPGVGFARGVEPNAVRSGVIDFWHNPFNYQKIIPLEEADFKSWQTYFSALPPAQPLPDGSVVIFQTAGANFSQYIPDWARMVRTLKSAGVEHVYVNQSGVSEYGYEGIVGATPLTLAHDELVRTFCSPHRHSIVSVRSGVLDILRFCKQRALVLYQPEPSGIFETCRFGLLRHEFDLIEAMCLNVSPEHQHQTIDLYLRGFIASQITR